MATGVVLQGIQRTLFNSAPIGNENSAKLAGCWIIEVSLYGKKWLVSENLGWLRQMLVYRGTGSCSTVTQIRPGGSCMEVVGLFKLFHGKKIILPPFMIAVRQSFD